MNEYNGGRSGSLQTAPLTQRGTPPSRVLLFQRLGLLEQMYHAILFVRRAVHGTTPRQAVVRSGHAPAVQHGATSSHCTAQHVTKGCSKQKRRCLVRSTTMLPTSSTQEERRGSLDPPTPSLFTLLQARSGHARLQKQYTLYSRRATQTNISANELSEHDGSGLPRHFSQC